METRSPAESQGHSPEVNDYQYQILNREYYNQHLSDRAVEAKWQSDAEMRAEYVGLTFELIEQIIEGDYDTVLFLDKSGRPVEWLVNELWTVFTDKEKPEFKFINIDANRLLGYHHEAPRPTSDEIANYLPSPQDIKELRQTYQKGENKDTSYLDEKNILIVDEIKVSGATSKITHRLLEEAFPSSNFDQYHWLTGATKTTATYEKGQEQRTTTVTKLPVWYHATDPRGRGVGDADPKESQFLSSPNITYQKGDEIESIRGTQDELSLDLRADISHLAKAVREGRQAVQPRGQDKYYYHTLPGGGIDYDHPRFKLAPPDPDAYSQYIARQKSRQNPTPE